ncbi:DUF3291 domain-containing protein [Pendulispora brunnea]|uniref:DUF3291 domain-containing protein n=1 Tax=Pendulispora brunnea TaxID=2905690 RepID=A0ABZ2KIN5_9BACT
MHLAQLNIAHLRAPIDSPELAAFVDALEPINALADAAPGFVWRLKEDPNQPRLTVKHEFGDHLLINFSIWESLESLWNYVYKTQHLDFLRRRREWFQRMAEPTMVMWWIPEGTIPIPAEAMERLQRLKAEGPSPMAFTYKDSYSSEEALAFMNAPLRQGQGPAATSRNS